MTARSAARPVPWGTVALLGVLGGIVSLVVIVSILRGTPPADPTDESLAGYVTTFSPPQNEFETWLLFGDGQAYGAFALDPGLSDTDAFVWGPSAMSYYAQRPVVPYLEWALSLGNRDALPVAATIVQVLGGALLVSSTAMLLVNRNRPPAWSLVVLALPFVAVTFPKFITDIPATGFAFWGLAIWERSTSRRASALAVVLLCLGALSRETIVVLVAAMALHEALRGRGWRAALPLAAVPAALVGWIAFASMRIGATGAEHSEGKNFAAPFAGFAKGVGSFERDDWVILAICVGLTVVGLIRGRGRRDVLSWIIVAFVGMMIVAGEWIWLTREATRDGWENWGRIYLPAVVAAIVLIIPSREQGRPGRRRPQLDEAARAGLPGAAGPR